MSLLESGYSNPALRRNTSTADATRMLEKVDGRDRVRGSLNAPGVAVAPPQVPEIAKIADAVTRMVGAGTSAAEQLARVGRVAEDNLIRDETQRVVDAVANQQGDPGFRTKEARSLFYRLQAQKDAASFDPASVQPREGEKIGDAMLRHINETAGQMPSEYRLEYFRLAAPDLANYHGRQIAKAKAEAVSDGVAALRLRMLKDGDLQAVNEDFGVMASTIAKDMDRGELVARTWGAAMKDAADNGDVDRVRQLSDFARQYAPAGPHGELLGIESQAQVTRAASVHRQMRAQEQTDLLNTAVYSIDSPSGQLSSIDSIRDKLEPSVYNEQRQRIVERAGGEAIGWLMNAPSHDDARRITQYAENSKLWNREQADKAVTAYRTNYWSQRASQVASGQISVNEFIDEIGKGVELHSGSPNDPAALPYSTAITYMQTAGMKQSQATKNDLWLQQIRTADANKQSLQLTSDADGAMVDFMAEQGNIELSEFDGKKIVSRINNPVMAADTAGRHGLIPKEVQSRIIAMLNSPNKQDFSQGVLFVGRLRNIRPEMGDEFIALNDLSPRTRARINEYLSVTNATIPYGIPATPQDESAHSGAVEVAWVAQTPLNNPEVTNRDAGWTGKDGLNRIAIKDEIRRAVSERFQSDEGVNAFFKRLSGKPVQTLNIHEKIADEYVRLVHSSYTGDGATGMQIAKAKAINIIASKYQPVYSPVAIQLQEAPYAFTQEMYNESRNDVKSILGQIHGDVMTERDIADRMREFDNLYTWRWSDQEQGRSIDGQTVNKRAGVWVLTKTGNGLVPTEVVVKRNGEKVMWLPKDDPANASAEVQSSWINRIQQLEQELRNRKPDLEPNPDNPHSLANPPVGLLDELRTFSSSNRAVDKQIAAQPAQKQQQNTKSRQATPSQPYNHWDADQRAKTQQQARRDWEQQQRK